MATYTLRGRQPSNLAPDISKTGNVALKLPKRPLLGDVMGDLSVALPADLGRMLLFDAILLLWVCWSQGLLQSF